MENLSKYCAPGTEIKEKMTAVSEFVSLRVITFMPKEKQIILLFYSLPVGLV